jgi:CO/xanthine dehydrogenase Mo-binding subunit
MVGFAADHALDGGGLANCSVSVATVGANTALGIYYVPKVDVTTYAFHSRGVTAGAMRGFGTLQTMTALEAMVDEICTALPLDPIEFRRRNALATGGRTMAGNTYSVSLIAGHGRKRPSRWPDRRGRPTSMRSPCAVARANLFASI